MTQRNVLFCFQQRTYWNCISIPLYCIWSYSPYQVKQGGNRLLSDTVSSVPQKLQKLNFPGFLETGSCWLIWLKYCRDSSGASLHLFVPPPVCQRPEEQGEKARLEEKEKTRLFLLEEKLTDALTLLLQLCNKVHTQYAHSHHSPQTHTHTSSVPPSVYSMPHLFFI